MFAQDLLSTTKPAEPGCSLCLQKNKKLRQKKYGKREKQPKETPVVDLKLDDSSDESSHLGEEDNNDDLPFSPSSLSIGDYVHSSSR